jgi:predicted O-linked N-acetylglucosamine transferase (SPINDLY family)
MTMASGLELMFRKARSAEKRGDETEARRLLEEVLATYPKNATARQGLARLGQKPVAPQDAGARINLLIAAHTRGDHQETVRIGRTLPDVEGVGTLVGAALLALGDYGEAEAAFRGEIRAQPGNAGHHNHLGVALLGQDRLEEAEAALQEALRLDASNLDAQLNLSNLRERQERFDDAIAACRAALDLKPDHVEGWHRLANLQRNARELGDAAESYIKLLAIEPEHGVALSELGRTLVDLEHYEEAAKTLRLAVRVNPTDGNAHCNLGLALSAAGRTDEAIVALAHATETMPNHYGLWGRLLAMQGYLCDWESRQVVPMLPVKTELSMIPFDALPFEDEPLRQLQRSQVYVGERHRPAMAPFVARPPRAGGRIRIGYFSADFYEHATLCLMSGLLRTHDRSRFEIHVYDFSPRASGMARARMGDQVDSFVHVRNMSDRQIVDLVRDHDLDIAVDLKGHTKDARVQIFAERVAPIQINYLGYPGSMGLESMDYILADPIVIPAGSEPFYSEKVLRLPHSYQPNDDGRTIIDSTDDRAGLGLPEDGFVFCCFNQAYKISPQEFDIWMRLLREVDGSVLWLVDSGEQAAANLRKEASRRGVDPDRLVFAAKRPHSEHLGRHRHADLFLDTFAVNAHTTASDALWGGLPVLTLAGRQFAARVAASVVTAVGLPELVAETEQAYFETALDLARSPERMKAITAKLAANRGTHPLFDTTGYARQIEAAFTAVHERRLQGLAPDHIQIG